MPRGTKNGEAARNGNGEEQAYVLLLRTAYGLERRVAQLLKPHALSPTQYNALRILRGAGLAGLPCSEIGARMINRDPDITRLVDRLEKRGLVRRSRGEKDRRVIRATITPAGLDLLKSLDQPVSAMVRGFGSSLGRERLQTLTESLEEMGR